MLKSGGFRKKVYSISDIQRVAKILKLKILNINFK